MNLINRSVIQSPAYFYDMKIEASHRGASTYNKW